MILVALLAMQTVWAQREDLRENPERYSGVHYRYEAPSEITDTPSPEGFEPFYVSHYGRHGSRYHAGDVYIRTCIGIFSPLADKGLLTREGMALFRELKAIEEAQSDMIGYLTQKGAREHREVAHRLYQRVPELFNQKDRSEVLAVSSIIQRCIQSMSNFCMQLKVENPALDISMYSGERYMKYILNGADIKHNPRHKAILDSVLAARFDPSRAMRAWFNDPEKASEYFNGFDAAHVCLYVYYISTTVDCLDEQLAGTYGFFTEDELFTLWQYDNMNNIDNMGFTQENRSGTKVVADHIMRDMIEKADAAVAGNNRAADLRFGHDSGLLPLISSLGLEGIDKVMPMVRTADPDGIFIYKFMPMCSSLQMIFYRNTAGEVLVKFVRNEMETTIPALKPVSGPYYSWTDVRAYMAEKCGYKNLRLVYWNIQNGMWDGQDDGYDRFVAWVSGLAPDICVWCEGQSIYYNGTATEMKKGERYLVDGWKDLAARYGHSYVYVGGHRDNYPQVITSKYPIENVKRITGAKPDSIVTHGAGWARIDVGGEKINVVTLHTWPQKWAYRAKDQSASAAAGGGDKYRRKEIEYICNHTILSCPSAADQMWMMMGDHNARSRVDNFFYGFAEDDSRFLVHDFILEKTPYVDVIADRHPGEFKTSMHGSSRIDFVYLTPNLNAKVVDASIVVDRYTEPVRNPEHLSNFWHPSDHRPVLVDFRL